MRPATNAISSCRGAITLFRDDGVIEHEVADRSPRTIAQLSRTAGCAAVFLPGNSAWSDSRLVQLAELLGGVSASLRHPAPVREIKPVSISDAPPNTLSSRYGTGAFSFDTDGAHWRTPPSFLVLHCISQGDAEPPTHLLPLGRWISTSLARVLSQEPWLATDGKRAFLTTPVCAATQRIRYDAACMRPVGTGCDRLDRRALP